MDTKQPSYQRPTKASLGRVKVFFQPEMKISKARIERTRVTKDRLDLADRIRQDLPPNEKWPDMSAVQSHSTSSQHHRRSLAENASPPKSPRSSICTKISSASSSKFPIPMRTSTSKDLTTFPQFSLLPAELRILVWKEAIFVPKFIELNYCLNERVRPGDARQSEYSIAQFINYQRYDVLRAVCSESREIAQQISPDPKELPYLTCANRSGRRAIPNPRPVFDERDTVFFRPIDHSLQNSIVPLATYFGGFLSSLRHIAIPLDLKRSVSGQLFWPIDATNLFYEFPKLKTLTLMLGCAEKTWRGEPSIELRDMEEWFADGRQRTVLVDDHPIYKYSSLGRAQHVKGQVSEHWRDRSWRDVADLPEIVDGFKGPNKNLKIRVVAWKRNISK